jgi:crotonobetainyl-CoA:carnitine CoA-transferase CaiB-like acyl-CoA transferase
MADPTGDDEHARTAARNRVLDFGRYIAGPYCAALLAEYGADVIRIEKRRQQTASRRRWAGAGALFLQMNRNKRSMTLDPASPEGRKVVERMVKRPTWSLPTCLRPR